MMHFPKLKRLAARSWKVRLWKLFFLWAPEVLDSWGVSLEYVSLGFNPTRLQYKLNRIDRGWRKVLSETWWEALVTMKRYQRHVNRSAITCCVQRKNGCKYDWYRTNNYVWPLPYLLINSQLMHSSHLTRQRGIECLVWVISALTENCSTREFYPMDNARDHWQSVLAYQYWHIQTNRSGVKACQAWLLSELHSDN